ncbi:MAG: hypothetical protein ACYCW6_17330, partial [Candidatus Xenobia bacterium]
MFLMGTFPSDTMRSPAWVLVGAVGVHQPGADPVQIAAVQVHHVDLVIWLPVPHALEDHVPAVRREVPLAVLDPTLRDGVLVAEIPGLLRILTVREQRGCQQHERKQNSSHSTHSAAQLVGRMPDLPDVVRPVIDFGRTGIQVSRL